MPTTLDLIVYVQEIMFQGYDLPDEFGITTAEAGSYKVVLSSGGSEVSGTIVIREDPMD